MIDIVYGLLALLGVALVLPLGISAVVWLVDKTLSRVEARADRRRVEAEVRRFRRELERLNSRLGS